MLGSQTIILVSLIFFSESEGEVDDIFSSKTTDKLQVIFKIFKFYSKIYFMLKVYLYFKYWERSNADYEAFKNIILNIFCDFFLILMTCTFSFLFFNLLWV